MRSDGERKLGKACLLHVLVWGKHSAKARFLIGSA